MTTTTTTGHKSKHTSKLNKDDCFNAFFLENSSFGGKWFIGLGLGFFNDRKFP
jgi:hypothetical protein